MVLVLTKQIEKLEIQELRRAKITGEGEGGRVDLCTRWDSRQRLSNSSRGRKSYFCAFASTCSGTFANRHLVRNPGRFHKRQLVVDHRSEKPLLALATYG